MTDHIKSVNIPVKILRYRVFRLFGEEQFGEWPTNKIQILNKFEGENFGHLPTIHQIHQYVIPPIFSAIPYSGENPHKIQTLYQMFSTLQ